MPSESAQALSDAQSNGATQQERLNVAGIVLAAGASTRMGAGVNKLLLDIGGQPMIRQTVTRVIAAGVTRVVVVVGHEADRIRSALDGLSCEFVENPDFTAPTSASLHAGLRALSAPVGADAAGAADAAAAAAPADATDSVNTTNAALVILGDMVHVTAAMLRSVVDAAGENDAPLVASRYGDVFAPPLLFRRELWPELLAWKGDGCGKAVVMAHRAEAAIVDWPDQTLVDVDTVADYRAVAKNR